MPLGLLCLTFSTISPLRAEHSGMRVTSARVVAVATVAATMAAAVAARLVERFWGALSL